MAIFPNAVPVRKSWDTAIIVLLFVVLVLASVTTDNFLTSLNISYIFSNTSEIMIIAFAMLFMIILGETNYAYKKLTSYFLKLKIGGRMTSYIPPPCKRLS